MKIIHKFVTRHKDYQVAFLFYLVFALVIFWPVFWGKVNLNGHLLVTFYTIYNQILPFKDTGWDQIRFFFPFLGFSLEQLKAGHIPFWDPYIFSGHAHLADFQTAIFYPLNIFGLFLSQIAFWHFLRITPYFMGAFFTYVYLKNLKLKTLAAFFGGLTFGFSPLLLTWGEEIVILPHGIIWLPLILFFVDKYLDEGKMRYLGFLTLAFSAALFSGFIQSSIYIFVLVIFYSIVKIGLKKLFRTPKGIKIVGGMLLSLTVAALQLLPSLELYLSSTRTIYSPQDLFKSLLPIDQLITYLAPDFFGNPATRNLIAVKGASYYEGVLFIGIAALILAFFALIVQNKNKIVRFYAFSALIGLFFSFDFLFAKLQLLLPIPFLSTALPNRVLFIPTFCLSILAAFGLDYYLKKSDRRLTKIIMILALIYMIIIAHLLIIIGFQLPYFKGETSLAIISLRNLVIPIVIFVVTSFLLLSGNQVKILKSFGVKIIICASLINIFLFSQKYFSFVERKFIFPPTQIFTFISQNQGYYRSLSMGADKVLSNTLLQYRIYYPEGYDPANIESYAQFVSLMRGAQVSPRARSVAELGSQNPEKFLGSSQNLKLLNILGVKYLFSEKINSAIFEKYQFKKVYEDTGPGGFAVFENPQVLPRAFLVSHFEKLTGQSAVSRLLAQDFDYRQSIIIKDATVEVSAMPQEGAAQILRYQPYEVVVKTESVAAKLLFLSDNYYPGWKATVDGYRVNILNADYTFRAVPVPKGEHIVRFYYDSSVFKIGVAISLVSLLLVWVLYFSKLFPRINH